MKVAASLAAKTNLVLPTETGARQNSSNVRDRVLTLSVKRADELLAERGLAPLPKGLTPPSMRRTFISPVLAIGEDVRYGMAQVGHADPKMTLSIYAQAMFRGEGEKERLEALIEGVEWPPTTRSLGISAQ